MADLNSFQVLAVALAHEALDKLGRRVGGKNDGSSILATPHYNLFVFLSLEAVSPLMSFHSDSDHFLSGLCG